MSTPDTPSDGAKDGAADGAANAAPRRRRRPIHPFWLALAALCVLLAALGWQAQRESTLQELAALLTRVSGGSMTVRGAHGSLFGPLRFEQLRYHTPERDIEATAVELDWQPLHLLRGDIAIARLKADTLTVTRLQASNEPLTLPATLALPRPLQLEVRSAQLAHLILVAGAVRTSIDEIGLALDGDAARWRVRDAHAATPWGAATAALTIATQAPFSLQGTADLLQANGQLGARASGTLAAPQLDLNARGHGGHGEAHLALAPFAPDWLRSASVKAEALDPAQWRAGWPQAQLTLEASLTLDAARQVKGALALANRAPSGSLDAQRLPLRTAAATFSGTPEALEVSNLQLDLGAAGRFDGGGTIGTAAAAQNATVRLHTARLDLKALHGMLRSTRIAGDIVLGTNGAAHTLKAKLTQDDLQLDLQAALDNTRLTLEQALLRARGSSARLAGTLELAGAGAFEATGSAAHFNPAHFGAWPAADLNADFHADGQTVGAWRANAAFAFKPSQLFGQPLSGHGSLQADASHLHGLDAALALGRNTLAAKGSFGAPADRLQWTIEAPELAALHAGLAGSVSARGILSGSYAAPASTFVLDARGVRLSGAAAAGPGTATVAGSNTGTLHASGTVQQRAGNTELALSGQAAQFDPALFGALAGLPSGRINAGFAINGVRTGGAGAARYRGALDLKLQPSTLGGAPLAGHAKLRFDGMRIFDADIDLQLAENRLTANGKFGAAGDTLAWRLDAPRLAALGAGFGGAVRADGTLAGSPAAPALSANASASKLTLFGTHMIGSLEARLRMTPQRQGALEAHLAMHNYRAPQPVLDSLTLDLNGTREAHVLQLSAAGTQFGLRTELRGRWNDGDWRGMLHSLQTSGNGAFALQAPAPLHVHLDSRQAGLGRLDQFSLGASLFRVGSGRIELQTLEKDGARWKSSGRASAVPLAFVTQWSPLLRDSAGGDLTLAADWALDLGATPDGTLHVYREKGDITLGTDTPLTLGLSTLEARVSASRGMLRAQLDLQGARAGTLHFDGSSELTRQDGHWRVAGESPLTLAGSANMPSIAWLAPLTGQVGLDLGGRLTLAMSGRGTLNTPQLSGQLQGDQLTVNWAGQGVKLHNGQLRAQLAGQQVLLQTLRFDGPQGTVQADGTLQFGGGEAGMQLKARADRLEALSRPDRVLVVSGTGSATLARKSLQLEGKFRAERAAIELAGQSGPTLSDDIVVVRGSAKAAPAAPAAIRVTIDVEADLGDQFHLKGRGLDAQLGGTVHIRTQERAIARATGAIRVVQGSYLAYGQKLKIERGVLTFNGALDNPGLNILAVRNSDDNLINTTAPSETNVQAGVEVRGTALAPTAKLVSTPNVADSEKLSWLVLGHGTEAVGSQELDLLSTAAGALLGSSQASSLQGRLAGRLGLDTIAMGRAKGLEATVLTVGKRISQRAYLTFERGASSASNLVKLHYALNKRLTLQAQTGATTAFDILYSWAFD